MCPYFDTQGPVYASAQAHTFEPFALFGQNAKIGRAASNLLHTPFRAIHCLQLFQFLHFGQNAKIGRAASNPPQNPETHQVTVQVPDPLDQEPRL